jgi:hypothetical protein
VEKRGTPGTVSASYALTRDGRAEVRRREPSSTITVDLGSGPVGLATSALDESAIAVVPSDVPDGSPSIRQRVIKALCDEREWTLMGLTQAIRTSHRDTVGPRDVGAVLNSLNQQGLVTFVEGGFENGHNSLTKIKATKRLLAQENVDTTSREVGTPRHVGEAPQHKTDRTDFRTHGHRAEGGPITTERAAPVIPQPKPEPIVGPEQFPIVRALVARRAQLTTAAQLLEDAGQDELALATLAKVDDYTPLEREAMALFALREEAAS